MDGDIMTFWLQLTVTILAAIGFAGYIVALWTMLRLHRLETNLRRYGIRL
jgi:hypothetical protein